MKKIFFLALLTFCISICCAQRTNDWTHPDKLFLEAKELYDLKDYNIAYLKFKQYLELTQKDRSALRGEAEYYVACCAYELRAKETRRLLDAFLSYYPNTTYANRVHFLKGSHLFNRHDFEGAQEEFDQCDANRLAKEEKYDYLSRSGYTALENQQLDKAKEKYTELLKDSTRYQLSASYYNAYIDYVNKNYDKAFPVFQALKEEEDYRSVVPYYLFQIHYARKDYEAVLTTGEELLATDPSNVNNKEVLRILGECYYDKKDYKNTIKYLSRYQKETMCQDKNHQVLRSNMYMLGNAYYQEGDYKSAIECFQAVTTVEDALCQNAYLFLGSCYVKDNNFNNARLCFESAGRMDFEKNVKEEAQYNYALIVYEQAYSPFNESITAFENFLTEFKNSRYKDKVYNYMTNLYLTTKNYEEALKSIQKIENKTLQIYEARQRITYSIGVQHLNNSDYKEAIASFDESIKDGKYNHEIEASAIFWRGEAYYRLKEYDKASNDYITFINSIGARSCDEFNIAHYNIGYTYFTKKDYPTALTWFRKYTSLESKNKTIIADANNRIGDCYFNQRDYDNAMKSYSNVYALKGPGADYACFQQGFIQGLKKDYSGKIQTMNKLINTFPQSEYLADATYEIGRSYVMMGQNQKAIDIYNKLNKEYPHSLLSRRGQLQTGMLYEEMEQLDKAANTYKEIVRNFPNSAEAKTAIESLKNVYIEKDDVQAFADYIGSLDGLAKFDKSEQDSLTYLAAQRLFEKEDYKRAASSFQNYLNKFPNSYFTHDAHYNLGNCYYKLGDKEKAEGEYTYTAALVGYPEREEALMRLSEIQYGAKNYAQAIVTMTTLDSIAQNAEYKQAARIGLLRSNNLLGRTEETIIAASQIINSDRLDPNIQREALYTRAKACEVKGDSAQAFDDFIALSANSLDEYGAEARYRVAEYYFIKDQLKQSEKAIFDFIEVNTPHQYWLAKSFVLLSKIYIQQDKDFEAKQYLMSVRENYTGKDDISTEIKVLLDQIEKREAEKIVNE